MLSSAARGLMAYCCRRCCLRTARWASSAASRLRISAYSGAVLNLIRLHDLADAGFRGHLMEEEPVHVAAFSPLGEVALGDGFAVEFGGQDFLDGGQGVQPEEDCFGLLAVEEPGVQFLADGQGEPGDLASA